jgi:hypothetical protein
MSRPTWQLGAFAGTLVGLIAANLLIDVGLIVLIQAWSRGQPWHHEVPVGTLLGQLTLIGLWFGLGDWRWYVRLVVVVPLTFCLAEALGTAEYLSSKTRRDFDPGNAMVFAFMLLAMMLAVSWVGFILRRTRSWRLTWQHVEAIPAMHQYQIGDALLWMVVVGGSLAAIRFLMSIDSDFPSQILFLALYAVKTTAVVLVAMTLAFATRRKLRAAGLLVIAVLLIGALFAVPDAYENVRNMRAGAGATPVPTYRYAVAWGNQTLKHEACVIATTFCAVANCLVLRLLGGQLVRPGGPSLRARKNDASQPPLASESVELEQTVPRTTD